MLCNRFPATTPLPSFMLISLVSLFAVFGLSKSLAQAQESAPVSDSPGAQSVQPGQLSAPKSLPPPGMAPPAMPPPPDGLPPPPDGLPPSGLPSCMRYDRNSTRIMATMFLPPACETVSPELFGMRDGLAASGWGVQALVSPVGDWDVRNDEPDGPQRYTGEKNGGAWILSAAYLTYDLTRIGFPAGGQLTGTVTYIRSKDRVGQAPSMDPTVTTLGIVQPLFDDTVELRVGYIPAIQDFLGVNLTGNAASSGQGLVSLIPALVGVGIYTPTPTAEITLKDPWTKNFYDHFGVSRSVSPSGPLEELKQNRSGLTWRTPGTSVLFINELGYKTKMTPAGGVPTWARVGFVYNMTDYQKFSAPPAAPPAAPPGDGPPAAPPPPEMASNNYAAYAALTMPLIKNARGPGGLNLDIRANYAPSDRNVNSKDYSINLFHMGLPGRPFDIVTVGFSQTFESREAQKMVEGLGTRNTSTVQTAGVFSYLCRLSRGFGLSSTATVLTNPGTVFGEKLPTALLISEKLVISF